MILTAVLIAVLGMSVRFPPNNKQKAAEKLAREYCGSCHLFVAPEIFAKAHWEQEIFPRMALFMGLYPNDSTRTALSGQEYIFPPQPLLSAADFEKIKAFYLKNAPENPVPVVSRLPKQDIPGFQVRIPEGKIIPPGVSMARFAESGQIFIGDSYAQKLFVFDSSLQPLNGGRIGEGLVDFKQTPDALFCTIMGHFSPSDAPEGFVLKVNRNNGMGYKAIENLYRPVHSAFGNLSGDSTEEIVIAEFGRYKGRLAWYEPAGDFYEAHVLLDRPGALQSDLRDLDGDGDLDITALFGQADEGIWQFFNDGSGHFTPKQLLRFSPANGSSSFEFVDFNQDGRLEILYTCGDNADFAPVLKPWHGIYLFEQTKNGQYRQQLFLPMPGCYKALARDFDRDGDTDIAAIAFFPDFSQTPVQSFLYFQNKGNAQFETYTFADVGLGRWMVMDAADPDADGDLDLLLGAMTFEVPGHPELIEQWKKGGLPFIVLENKFQ